MVGLAHHRVHASSVTARPRCVLRPPSAERAPVVQGLGELTLERGHAKAMIVWPAGRAGRAVRSEAVQGSYEVPPGGRAAHPVLWRSPPHRCAASAVRRVLGTRARHFGQRGAHGRDQELRDCVSADGLGVSTSGSYEIPHMWGISSGAGESRSSPPRGSMAHARCA